MEAKLKLAQQGDEQAVYEILTENDGLIRNAMKQFFKNTFDEDLHSMGVLTMIKAIRTFDVEQGVKFSSYVCACLNNTYLREVKRQQTDKYRTLNNTVSIQEETIEGCTIGDLIADPFSHRNIEDSVMPKAEDFVHLLNERERIIFEMRYLEGKKRSEIAKALGILPTSVARPLQSMKAKLAKELGIDYVNSYTRENERKKIKYAESKKARSV